jgi:hypothetical protein
MKKTSFVATMWVLSLVLILPACDGKHGGHDADGEDVDGGGDWDGEGAEAGDVEGLDAPDGDDADASDIPDMPDIPVTVFVVPAITDVKVCSDSVLSGHDEASEMSMTAAPGEDEPASFVVRAGEDITSLLAASTDLQGPGGAVIPSAGVDIRVVKCWYQAGLEVWDVDDRLLTPELLLKDDAMVNVEGGENYLKVGEGEYVWISDSTDIDGRLVIPPSELPVRDSPALQPVDVPAGTAKQFWVTVSVPRDAAAGDYTGSIVLTTPEGGRRIALNLRVLPFTLADPFLVYSIYYRAVLSDDWPEGSISSEYKSEAQLRAELENMFRHGVTNPTVYQGFDETMLGTVLSMRNEAGMVDRPLYFLGMGTGNSPDPAELAAKTAQVGSLVSFVAPFGVTDVFIYGIDEATADALLAQRPAWEAVHAGGGKVFVAGYTAEDHPPGNFSVMGDLQDLIICAGEPSAAEAALWHNETMRPHQIFDYANPQVGVEKPETYRRNFGLLLWQKDYDGAMDYAYQDGFGSVWNDFDHVDYRDHNFTYPTVDGVIDTVEWEGFREGVDDARYLATLQALLEEKRAEGQDTSFSDEWIAQLKAGPLVDLDAIRAGIVGHILCWLGEGPCCGNGSADTMEACDGSDLHGRTCADAGFTGGTLACAGDCTLDTCGCTPPQTSVSFVDPTPAEGALIADDVVRVSAETESSCGRLGGFIDWNDSLRGYWNLDEGAGGEAADASSFGRTCTLANGPAWVDGVFGPALSFDGADDAVSCGDLGIAENGTATIEGWFYFAEMAMEKGSHIALMTNLYQHMVNNEFYISGTNDYFDVTPLLRKNEWCHIVLTWSGDSGSARLHFNGTPVDVTIQGETETIGSLSDFRIGNTIGYSFSGIIDEVRVWDRILPPDEIETSLDAKAYPPLGTFTGLADGEYHYYARVTDPNGNSARTETRTLTISAP